MATQKPKIPAATVQKPNTEAGADAATGKKKKAASAAKRPVNGAKKAPPATAAKKPAPAGTAEKPKAKAASTGKKPTVKPKSASAGTKKPKAEKPITEPAVTAQTPTEEIPQVEAALPVPAAENMPATEEPLPAVNFPESAVRAEKKSFAGRVLFLVCIAAVLLASYFIFLYRPGSYAGSSGTVVTFTDAERTTCIVVNGTVRQQVTGAVRDRQSNDRGTVCVLLIDDALYVVKNRAVSKLSDGVKDFTLSAKGTAVAYRDGADNLYYAVLGKKTAPAVFPHVHDGRYCLSPNGKELAYTWEHNGTPRLRVYSTSGHEVHIEQDEGLYPLALADKCKYLYYGDASGALFLQTGRDVQKLADTFESASLCFNGRFDELLFRTAEKTLWVRRGAVNELTLTDGATARIVYLPNHMTAVRILKTGVQYPVRTFARNYFSAGNDSGSRLAYLKGDRKAPGVLTVISTVDTGSVTVTDKAVYFLLTEKSGRTALHRTPAGRVNEKLLLWDVASYCPNVDGSRFLYTLDDHALYSARVGLFRTVSERIGIDSTVDPDRIFVTADDVFYFFSTDGTLCRSDNGDDCRKVSDRVVMIRIDGHLALYAVRGEDGQITVYANYQNRRRDTVIADSMKLLEP